MNEEEIKLLNKIEELPKELNIEIRGLILAEICLRKENQQLKEQLKQKEDIIYKIKKCIEEKEEYYGDYMGDGNYTMYSMMGANNNRIPYIKSNLIKQILDNKGE